MSTTLQDLEQVLRHETDLHRQLLAAAEDKRKAIIEGDLPGLETLLQVEQKLIAAVEKEEQARQQLVETARGEFDLGPGAIKMVAIAEAVPEPWGERLIAVREELRQVLDKLRFRTRQNAELLHASLEHIDGFLRMVAEAGSPDTGYGRDGRRKHGDFSLLDKSA